MRQDADAGEYARADDDREEIDERISATASAPSRLTDFSDKFRALSATDVLDFTAGRGDKLDYIASRRIMRAHGGRCARFVTRTPAAYHARFVLFSS